MSRFCAAVAGEPGNELVSILAKLEKKGFVSDSHETYKRVPKGFDADHPRAEHLKEKGPHREFCVPFGMRVAFTRAMTPELAPIKLLTIIAPSELSDLIRDDLDAVGYTYLTVRGKGAHGLREGGLLSSTNVEIQVLASATRVAEILERIEVEYVARFPVVAYVVPAEAFPAAKFR